MPAEIAPQSELEAALRARVAELEASLASTRTELKTVRAERDKLRRAYDQLKAHLELLRRRIFMAKAERIDTRQLELEYAQKLRELDHLAGTLGIGKRPDVEEDDNALPAAEPGQRYSTAVPVRRAASARRRAFRVAARARR